ncbi:energy transducer TonB [Candidatus Kirkpatrickella diaphorinae]|uniref:Energy transducer TonB n=1 Tax=Candidatus Kirkpatrickella diaphorinae TaxID=2984322 RepID=A0ABY6GIJ8_9PROT|nr:energy transducer TonB [Candidatus Kirkpatrickella diaphorinae]UYH50521.1 energy transducer TonB [Candidatus Kirkpatrickella diaphorinae]
MHRPLSADTRRFRRSAVASGLLHLGVILWIVIYMHGSVPPEPPPPDSVDVTLDVDAPPSIPHKSDQLSKEKSPAPAPVTEDAPPSPDVPKDVPNEEPPPAPPPPPPIPPAATSDAQTLPELKPMEKLPDDDAEPIKTVPTPPSPPSAAHQVVPPQALTRRDVAPPKIFQPSHITQPNVTKKMQTDSHSLLSTLDAFRVDQKQTHPPKARANPKQGGAPKGAGAPEGDITSALTPTQRGAIGQGVRRCYTQDTAAQNYASFSAALEITVDAQGVARRAELSADTMRRAESDPVFQVFAERARQAVLSPTCAKLRLPPQMLGDVHRLKFIFRP